jgi:hypothetical protein
VKLARARRDNSRSLIRIPPRTRSDEAYVHINSDKFQRCDSDPACNEAFPALADEWAELIERFETPLTVVDPESSEEAVIGLTDLTIKQ